MQILHIRQDFLAACNGALCPAVILDRLDKWTAGEAEAPTEIDRVDGWLILTQAQLVEGLLGCFGVKQVRAAAQFLADKGLIAIRPMPNPLDRRSQYRVDVDQLIAAINSSFSAASPNVPSGTIESADLPIGESTDTASTAVSSIVPIRLMESADLPNALGDPAQCVKSPESSDLDQAKHVKQIGEIADYRDSMRLVQPLLRIEVFPVIGKQPAPLVEGGVAYQWGKQRLNKPGIHRASKYAWERATGYGMTAIPDDPLVFIDVDRCEFEEQLIELLPSLRKTYRQQRDDHSCYAIRLPALLPKRIELADDAGEIASLRGFKSYQIGGGSLHPSGAKYVITHLYPPVTLNDAQNKALLVLFGYAPDKVGDQKLAQSLLSGARNANAGQVYADLDPETTRRLTGWAQRGINRAVEGVGRDRSRYNEALFNAAYRSACLAEYSGDSDAQITQMLMSQAIASGYAARDGKAQAAATIRSGLKLGHRDGVVTLPPWASKRDRKTNETKGA